MIDSLSLVVKSTWPTLVIFLSIIIIIRITYLKNTGKKFVFHEEVFLLLFIAYVLVLFQLVTYKEASNGGVNLMPFAEIFRYNFGSEGFYVQVVGNILAFIPFGYCVSYYAQVKKISGIFLIGILTSTIIEVVQYFIGRSFDIDDIILNVVGCILGFLLYTGLHAIKKKLPDFFKKDIFINIISLIILALVAMYFFGFGFWG